MHKSGCAEIASETVVAHTNCAKCARSNRGTHNKCAQIVTEAAGAHICAKIVPEAGGAQKNCAIGLLAGLLGISLASNNIKIGICRFDFNEKDSSSEVSINMNPEMRSLGFGKRFLFQCIEVYLNIENHESTNC